MSCIDIRHNAGKWIYDAKKQGRKHSVFAVFMCNIVICELHRIQCIELIGCGRVCANRFYFPLFLKHLNPQIYLSALPIDSEFIEAVWARFEFSFGHKQEYLARCSRNHNRYQVLLSIWPWRDGVGPLQYPEILPGHQQFFD